MSVDFERFSTEEYFGTFWAQTFETTPTPFRENSAFFVLDRQQLQTMTESQATEALPRNAALIAQHE